MGLVVDLGQMLVIEMGVDLGCTQVGVPQKLLDSPKIATGFQKVTRKRVPEHVRMDSSRAPLLELPARQPRLNAAR